MKKIVSIVALVVLFSLCLSLCACGIEKKDVVGTWGGSYTYEGNSFSVGLALTDGGDYAKVTYKNGSLKSEESGTYEIDGRKVKLHPDGNKNSTTEYKYKDGTLENNGHKLTKKK